MRVREALAAAAAKLEPISATPRLDAELLMAHALGVPREAMLLSRLDGEVPPGFASLVERRIRHEPVAYITGQRAFWTIELEVGPGVLIPRPDSETLIDAALERFGEAGPARILDLGTGPGTLLLAALDQWPEATGIGVDRSQAALGFARRNAERLGLAARSDWRCADWGEGLVDRFDLVLCNPPYVEQGAPLDAEVADWEPAEALYAGADGLDAYRRLAPMLPDLLATEGLACIELGAGQAEAASKLFQAEGFRVSTRSDLAGLPRCLLAAVNK
jgi:release factor glutamine methyltransferase